jgi:hypothetical protein
MSARIQIENAWIEEQIRMQAEFDESERVYFNSLNEPRFREYEETIREMPTPIRLDPIFREEWNNRLRRSDPLTNPKIGDITTVTFVVNEEIKAKLKTEEFDCPICYTSVYKWDAVQLNCAHVFCGSCVSNHLDTLHKNHALLPSCALCRTEYTLFEIPNPEISNEIECMLRK